MTSPLTLRRPPRRARRRGVDDEPSRLTVPTGLAALSLDAMASVAYGPEAVVLALAGSAGLGFTLPVTAAIALLLVVLTVSYRQVIAAFPDGGGSWGSPSRRRAWSGTGFATDLRAGTASSPSTRSARSWRRRGHRHRHEVRGGRLAHRRHAAAPRPRDGSGRAGPYPDRRPPRARQGAEPARAPPLTRHRPGQRGLAAHP